MRTFFTGGERGTSVPPVGKVFEGFKLVRRSDQFVATSAFSEGSVLDRSGVWRAFGYLHGAPREHSPWMSKEADSVAIDEEVLASAPWYEGSWLIFYNGNLRNYYHWTAEGMLSLDILSQSLGQGSNLKLPLTKTMDENSIFDNRESLRALGFDRFEMVEVADNLIRVQEGPNPAVPERRVHRLAAWRWPGKSSFLRAGNEGYRTLASFRSAAVLLVDFREAGTGAWHAILCHGRGRRV